MDGWTGGRGEDFGEGRPHAPSTPGANSDVGVWVLGSESEEWTNWDTVNVENMLCTW